MTGASSPDVVVVDTMVISWLFAERPNLLADRYRDLIGSARVLLAFQAVMELRFGALRAGWGELQRRRLERGIAELTVTHAREPETARTASPRRSGEFNTVISHLDLTSPPAPPVTVTDRCRLCVAAAEALSAARVGRMGCAAREVGPASA